MLIECREFYLFKQKFGDFMFKSLKVALMSIVMAISLTGCFGGGPEKAASAYMDAAIANDVDKLMTTIHLGDAGSTKTEVIKGKLKIGLKLSAEKAQNHGGYDKYTISDVMVKDNLATLKVKTAYKDGTVEVTDLSLEKVNDQWLVILQ